MYQTAISFVFLLIIILGNFLFSISVIIIIAINRISLMMGA